MSISDEAFELANRRGEEQKRRFPAAVEVRFDDSTSELVIVLSSGSAIIFPAHALAELSDSSPEQLGNVQISPSGMGIHFPALDVDLYLPALAERFAPQPIE